MFCVKFIYKYSIIYIRYMLRWCIDQHRWHASNEPGFESRTRSQIQIPKNFVKLNFIYFLNFYHYLGGWRNITLEDPYPENEIFPPLPHFIFMRADVQVSNLFFMFLWEIFSKFSKFTLFSRFPLNICSCCHAFMDMGPRKNLTNPRRQHRETVDKTSPDSWFTVPSSLGEIPWQGERLY